MTAFMQEALPVIALVFAPTALLGVNIYLHIKGKPSRKYETACYIVGSFFTLMAMELFPYWRQPIITDGNAFKIHEFISSPHKPTLYFFLVLSYGAYLKLTYSQKLLSPVKKLLCIGGSFIGTVLCALLLAQLYGGIAINCNDLFMCSLIFDISIIPLSFFVTSVMELTRAVREWDMEEPSENEKGLINRLNRFIWGFKRKGLLAALAALPILVVGIGILCLFGQRPDSIIQIFTDTDDWLLSCRTSPPPVMANSDHYLCTVSLRGHKRVVKPIRYGVRRGKKIIVNRQLCVANAFEELIAEKTPRFHKGLRAFYDKYGYPASRHIKTAFAADVVYLAMKPLEWLFLLVLYTVDIKPENRIARQYLPVEKQREFGKLA